MMEYGFGYCDILKISDNEIQFVSGKEDYDEGIQYLIEKYNIPLIFLTMGKDGSRAYYKGMRVEQPGFSVKTIETTGAGDTFCGSVINGVIEKGMEALKEEDLKEILTFANAGAALVTTRKGAIKSMPEREDVWKLAKKVALKMKDKLHCDGVNLVQNNEEAAGQTVFGIVGPSFDCGFGKILC